MFRLFRILPFKTISDSGCDMNNYIYWIHVMNTEEPFRIKYLSSAFQIIEESLLLLLWSELFRYVTIEMKNRIQMHIVI